MVALAGTPLKPLPYLARSSIISHMQTLLQLGGLEKSKEHQRITKEGICELAVVQRHLVLPFTLSEGVFICVQYS